MSPGQTICLCLAGCLFATRTAAQNSDTITVHFDVDRYSITPQSDSIFAAWFRNGGLSMSVRIAGYCDYTGTVAHNERLSLNRAQAVSDYLRSRLDSVSIISVAGFGSRDPIGDNRTKEGRALNRRVRIIAVSHPAPAPTQSPASTRSSAPAQPTIVQTPSSVYTAITDTSTRAGMNIALKDVVFYGGRRMPLPASYKTLDELVRALQDNDRLRIRIEGHVCCTPDSTDGPDLDTGQPNLSVQRARFVYNYLVAKGIAKDRLSFIGLGGSHKLYPEEYNSSQQAGNRRVVIVIISK